MSDLGNLSVNLSANIAEFNRNMDEAARRTETAGRRMDVAVGAAKAAIVALAGAVSVGAFSALVKGAIDAADNLRDMSQQTGIAVEDLNGLGFAAGQAGGSLESMVSAAGKLNKAITDTAGGNKEAAAAFKMLGISVFDANGNLKKADMVMAEVADQFAKYSDGPGKAAIAIALFSKAGADMIPVLNEGGDAMRESIAYAKEYSGQTSELSLQADEFNDLMGKLAVQQKSFGNAMASAVLPVINALTAEILGATEESNKWALATEIVQTILETFAVVGSEVAYTFKQVGTEIGATAAQLAALATLDFQGAKIIGDRLEEDNAAALAKQKAFVQQLLNRSPAKVAADEVAKIKPDAPLLPGAAKVPKPKAEKTDAQRLDEEGKRLVARLKEQDQAFGLSGAALLEYQLAQSKIPEAYKEMAIASQLSIDAQKAVADESKRNLQDQAARDQEQARAKLQNTNDVEQIRQSMLSIAAVEDEAHAQRMAALDAYRAQDQENIGLAHAMELEELTRHEQAKADIKAQTDQMMLASYSGAADQLYSLMQQAGLQQTAIGKAAFLASKALAVAQIIVSTNVAAATALAPPPLGLGPVAGVGLAATIKAMGYASAGMTAGLAIAQASAEGGFDIPAGQNPVTQLHEKEMVLPKAQANVIRDLATGGRGSAGPIQVTYSPNIQIDGATDMARNRQMIDTAVRDGNADLVDRLQRAGKI